MIGSGDFLLLTMVRAAEVLDQAVEELSLATADLRLDDPKAVAAFAQIDELMAVWHVLRLIVAGLPATTPAGIAAWRRLLGFNHRAAVDHSANRLSPNMVNVIRVMTGVRRRAGRAPTFSAPTAEARQARSRLAAA